MIFSSDKVIWGASAALKVAEPAIHTAAKITRKKCFIDLRLIELSSNAARFLAGAAGYLARHSMTGTRRL
jgi:hypothetical protein